MHTGHLILVKAESHEDAINSVWTILNTDSEHFAASWSDWCVVGEGSRWDFRSEFADEEDFEWDGDSIYAVGLSEEPELFSKAVAHFYGLRESSFERIREGIEEPSLDYFSLDQNDMKSWKLYRLAQLAESVYCPDSCIYDLENYSADLKYFREDSSENWYGVLVDFHF